MNVADLKIGDVVKNPSPHRPWGVVWKTGSDQYRSSFMDPDGMFYGGPYNTVEVIPATPEIISAMRNSTNSSLLTTVGCGMCTGMDPEMFVVDEKGDVIPAFEFLPSKEKARNIKVAYGNIKTFWDGFQAEFTIPGQTCHGYTTDYVRLGLLEILTAAREKFPSAKLSIASALPISDMLMEKTDPVHLQLGCAPSRNAYGEPPLGIPDAKCLPHRFAGAHMHFGSTTIPRDRVDGVVQFLDATAGLAMVALSEGFTNTKRREYYGRAGEYRFHPALPGSDRLEYRVPDTILLSHPATFNAIWDFTRVCFRMAQAELGFLWDAHPDEVRQAINESNVKLARDILIRNKVVLRNIMNRANPGWGNTNEVWSGAMEKLFFGGIGEVVQDPTDVEGNWWLGKPTAVVKIDVNQNTDVAWLEESYSRKHALWPYGRIWSSASEFVMEGKKV